MKNLEFMSRWHFGSDWCTPPLQENEIGLNMNAIEKKIISSEVIKYILQSTPPFPGPYLILCMHRKIVHFNFKWIFENLNFWFSDDSDTRVRWWNREKRPPKSLKNEMFISGLHSISDDQLSNPSDERQSKCQKRPPMSSKN